MKLLDRFTLDHSKVDPPRLHNDLNRLADQANANFTDHNGRIGALETQIKNLLAQVAALQNAQQS